MSELELLVAALTEELNRLLDLLEQELEGDE